MLLGFVIILLFLVVNSVAAQNSHDWDFYKQVLEKVGSESKILRKQLKEVNEEFKKTSKWKVDNEKIIADLLKLLPYNNCDNLFKIGKVNSGVEEMCPYNDCTAANFIQAYCEYIVVGEYQGGWTVIQRRDDNVTERETFNRTWEEYVAGFGNAEEEYWIGLKAIHALTNRQPMQLQIILEDWENRTETLTYDQFRIDDESKKFKLQITGYNGNIYDPMADHNNCYFSTMDRNNVEVSTNCAMVTGGGGWWYTSFCYGFNPTYARRFVMMVKPRV